MRGTQQPSFQVPGRRATCMRRSFFGVSAVLLFALGAAAQPLRIATWQADDFPAPPSGATQNDPDVKRLKQVAAALKPFDASVIVLEGMADRNSCQRLAGFLKPANFQVIQFSTFRGVSNSPVTRSVAVLGRRAATSTPRTVDWKSSGQIDGGGGFHFSTLTMGTNTVCLYVSQFVDLAGARTNTRIAQLNARKRELAAQYLLHHSKWLESSLNQPNMAFLALGNLADGLALWPGDGSVQVLEHAGFAGNPLAPASEPASQPFPQLFARNAIFDGAPQSAAPRGFGTGPILYELTAKPAPPPPPMAAIATGLPAPGLDAAGARQKSGAVDERFLWLAAPVVGAVLIFLLLLLPYRMLQGKHTRALTNTSTSNALVPARPASNALVVDFAKTEEESATLEPGRPPGGEPDDASYPGWQERARKAEERAHRATAVVREGLMPQFVRLMREKVLQRLSSQRAHLIDSHVTGTMQVLELEERLEKIQSQFHTRLTAREQRVTDLEKELAAKDGFIRELLKAQTKTDHRVSNE